jgi:hypothetical protein
MRFLTRALLVVSLSIGAPLSAAAALPLSEGVGIYLVIVAPVTFSSFSHLDSTKDRVTEIEGYFASAYSELARTDNCVGFPEKSHTCLVTAPAASHDEIRALLFDRLTRIPLDSLVFFFVLSHGVKAVYPATTSGHIDLFIAASDTQPDALAASGIRGSEFFEAMLRMSPRTRTFLFVDTCNAGALAPSRDLFASARTQGYSAFAVLASGSDETAYAADFSHQLLAKLAASQSSCLTGHDLVESVNKSLGTSNSKQRGESLVDYDGPCINVAVGSGLLLISNPRDEQVQVAISDGATKQVVSTVTVSANTVMSVVPLPRRHWTGRVLAGPDHEDHIGDLDADLQQYAATLYVTPHDDVTVSAASVRQEEVLARAAAISESFGYTRDATHFKYVAIGVARARNDEVKAQAIIETLKRELLNPGERAALEFPQHANVRGLDLARELTMIGKPDYAATLFEEAFRTQKTADVFNGLYASYILGGQQEMAEQLARLHPSLAKGSVAVGLGSALKGRGLQWLTTMANDPTIQAPSVLLDRRVDTVARRTLRDLGIGATVATLNGKTEVTTDSAEAAEKIRSALRGIAPKLGTIRVEEYFALGPNPPPP